MVCQLRTFLVELFVVFCLVGGVVECAHSAENKLRSPMGAEIKNTGKYLVWGDYKIEVNQYGGFGRDWPWQFKEEQYEMLRKKAEANPEPPNTIRAILLICPVVEATAYKKEGDEEIEVGRKTSKMTSAEIKSAIEQWRQLEDLVYVFSGGNAWLLTDIKVIPEPLEVKTNDNYGFWSGPKYDLLDKYLPFDRGEYDSYNSVYSDRGLSAGPWGGTLGALVGVKGMPTSDNLWIARGKPTDDMHAWVFWHEWLNQCASTMSNILPYPDNEELWNLYVFEWQGYRGDGKYLKLMPGWTQHRDVMRFAIRPQMWRRWSVTEPYISRAIGEWVIFGPMEDGLARDLSTRDVKDGGRLLKMEMGKYTHFNLTEAQTEKPEPLEHGSYYLRTYVESAEEKEVRLMSGGDERFQIWLNGNMVRDGWGWNYSEDDGKLFEKVTYTTLKKGVNTLVLVLPNTDDKAEFRVRFCKTDGTGEQPEGVTAYAFPKEMKPLPLDELIVHHFENPTFYKWADVGDDPWLMMPRMTEDDLRDLTGIPTLKVRTEGKRLKVEEKGRDGKVIQKEYLPGQHLLFDVPEDSVSSPWISGPVENSARLNNDLDFNWKSVAWLRVPGRKGEEKDILFLRFDIAEPLMHLLKTKGRPGNESIVGWLLMNRKIVYVVAVNLDTDKAPETELGLLTQQPQ